MQNSNSNAGANAEQSTNAEVPTSSPTIGNTNVGCCTPLAETAMQEIMNIVEMDYANGVEISMKVFYKMLSNGLRKEREQLIDAFDNGQANWDAKCQDYKNGTEYFNNTYKK